MLNQYHFSGKKIKFYCNTTEKNNLIKNSLEILNVIT